MWFFQRLPFNMNSWPGYTLAYFIESVGLFAACIVSPNVQSIFIGSCWILKSLGEDITNDLHKFNEMKLSRRNQKEIRRRFLNVVDRLSHAKQFSMNF